MNSEDDTQELEIRKICKTCENYKEAKQDNDTHVCQICACPIPYLIQYKTCPNGKWNVDKL